MKFQRSILLPIILLLGKNVIAQTFEGIWKGTSLCQVKNSPCHNEMVVYHISKDSNGKSYKMQANKIVNGKEADMGIISFTYDPQQKAFISVDSEANARWEFKITGDSMKGTLMLQGNLFRIVDAKKEN
jgi:hypothetical protein